MHRLEPAADDRTCGLLALMWQSPIATCLQVLFASQRPRGPEVVKLVYARRPEACSRGQLAAARSLGLAS